MTEMTRVQAMEVAIKLVMSAFEGGWLKKESGATVAGHAAEAIEKLTAEVQRISKG